jgi:hypothetical protein
MTIQSIKHRTYLHHPATKIHGTRPRRPERFDRTLASLKDFADPIITGSITDAATWESRSTRMEPRGLTRRDRPDEDSARQPAGERLVATTTLSPSNINPRALTTVRGRR